MSDPKRPSGRASKRNPRQLEIRNEARGNGNTIAYLAAWIIIPEAPYALPAKTI